MPKFRVVLGGGCSLDHFNSRPDAAAVLPAAAGAAEPFSEDGACGDDASAVFIQRSGQRRCLAGRPHAGGDERSEQVGRNGEPAAFGDTVHAADEFKSEARTQQRFENMGEPLPRPFEAHRDQPRRDNRRALSSPRWSLAKSNTSSSSVNSALAPKSTLASRRTGRSMCKKPRRRPGRRGHAPARRG